MIAEETDHLLIVAHDRALVYQALVDVSGPVGRFTSWAAAGAANRNRAQSPRANAFRTNLPIGDRAAALALEAGEAPCLVRLDQATRCHKGPLRPYKMRKVVSRAVVTDTTSSKLRGKDSNLDYLIQSQASYH